jgi:hypothetical protein
MRIRITNRTALDINGERLLDFVWAYLSETFPNPNREGCPSDAALRSLALNPNESDPRVVEHLGACSPCFKRYAELLSESRWRQKSDEGLSWTRMFAWTKAHPLLVGAALVCALFVAIGIGLLLRGVRQPHAVPLDTNRRPNPTEPQPPTVTYSPFNLDLSTLSPARGSAPSATARRVSVPNSPLRLTLNLPLASPEGTYDLKLTANGQTFWSKSPQAHLHKGKTLIQIDTDFRQIRTGNYNLEVRSSTRTRLIQPVSIQAAGPNEDTKP